VIPLAAELGRRHRISRRRTIQATLSACTRFDPKNVVLISIPATARACLPRRAIVVKISGSAAAGEDAQHRGVRYQSWGRDESRQYRVSGRTKLPFRC